MKISLCGGEVKDTGKIGLPAKYGTGFGPREFHTSVD
jgi:hypothetical protein